MEAHMSNSGVTLTERLVYVLPRIRLSGTAYHQERFSISKADFLPDEPSSWDEVIGFKRPDCLNIYRQFPYQHREEPAEPARGTLVITSDESWLRRHASKLFAVVYVMGIEESQWGVPADAFVYSSFKATSNPSDLVTLHTKTRGKTEDLRSLQLTPPLELRAISSSFRVDVGKPQHVELIRRFNENPYDRLATACYHLFRSQFDNPVVASAEQDFAAFCACLEAAFDIDGSDCSKKLTDRITGLYGGHAKLERWIKGLYFERSVFNHGIAVEPTMSSSDDRVKALVEFRERPLSWDVLRKLCLDVILDQLQESIEASRRGPARLMNPMKTLLRQFFDSEAIWNEIAKVCTQANSVKKILALSGNELDGFIDMCCAFLNGHRWQAMKGKTDKKKVLAVLMTLAAVFGELAKKNHIEADVQSADCLFQAAKAGNLDAIDSWAREHAPWEELLAVANIGDAAKAAAVHTALFFRRT
jgi:hypothetical protein